MKLSILDSSPVMDKSPEQALQDSLALAKLGDCLGYTRYWLTEHHSMKQLASSAPEVLLAFIGGQTSQIRLGTGAILLPHYKPLKVAEVHHTLASLFPGRIDLGLGRAPGGSAEVTMALSDNYLEQVRKFPDSVKELLDFLDGSFPGNTMYSKIDVTPIPKIKPEPWLLGTSEKSAKLAADNGLAYAFGQFMSDQDGIAIIKHYKENFKPREKGAGPKVILTMNAVCTESHNTANQIMKWLAIGKVARLRGQEQAKPFEQIDTVPLTKEVEDTLQVMEQQTVWGTPDEVKRQLHEVSKRFGIDEVMLQAHAPTRDIQLQSFELIAKVCL